MAKRFQVDTGGTLTTSLLGYWKLDETSGGVLDFYSTNNGTVAGNPTQGASGKIQYAITFDGTGDYVDFGTGFANFGKTSAFSASFWLKTSTGGATYFSKRQATSPFPGWVILDDVDGVSANGRLSVRMIGGAGGSNELRVYTSTDDLTLDGSYHHIVMTYSGSDTAAGIKTYIDGSANTHTVSINGFGGTMTGTGSVNLGGERNGSGLMTGSVDEVGIWSKVLSTTEVADLYNGGNGQTMVEAGHSNTLLMGV